MSLQTQARFLLPGSGCEAVPLPVATVPTHSWFLFDLHWDHNALDLQETRNPLKRNYKRSKEQLPLTKSTVIKRTLIWEQWEMTVRSSKPHRLLPNATHTFPDLSLKSGGRQARLWLRMNVLKSQKIYWTLKRRLRTSQRLELCRYREYITRSTTRRQLQQTWREISSCFGFEAFYVMLFAFKKTSAGGIQTFRYYISLSLRRGQRDSSK